MKKANLILTAAMAGALLCACSPQKDLEPTILTTASITDTQTEIPAEAAAEPVTESTQQESSETYPETLELTVQIEGMEESMPVELWDRGKYIIYFPIDDWYLETEYEDGCLEESWENVYNGNVELSVLHLGTDGREKAERYLALEADDYVFSPWDEENRCQGYDAGDLEYMDVRFVAGEQENFLLLSQYDVEAYEGFGIRMQSIMDTFQIK